jgi:hypothetical protein
MVLKSGIKRPVKGTEVKLFCQRNGLCFLCTGNIASCVNKQIDK